MQIRWGAIVWNTLIWIGILTTLQTLGRFDPTMWQFWALAILIWTLQKPSKN